MTEFRPAMVDPELRPWLGFMPTLDVGDLEAARAEVLAMVRAAPAYVPEHPLDVRDLLVPGHEGAPKVPVRVYVPAGRAGPLGAMLHVHAGGFVLGSVEGEDATAAETAAECGVVVVSVEYRLAPEHPFPAGLDDCWAALTWLVDGAEDLGVDPSRVAVGGDSAGGGLAAALALRARDQGGPPLRLQVLGIPELDDRLDTPSMRAFTDTPVWRRSNAVLSWRHYLGGRTATPYAAPARAEDLSGLPPAHVTVAEIDPLRDEGIAYASRLLAAGVPTSLHLEAGTFHGSGLVREAAVSRRSAEARLTAIRQALG